MSSELKKTAKHSGSYFLMQIATKFMAFVSFPIITRLLTIHEYGILAIANTTLLFLYAIGKCGLPSALIARVTESHRDESNRIYNQSLSLIITTSVLVGALYLLLLLFVKTFYEIPIVFYILIPCVLIRNVFDLYQAWLRANEKIFFRNAANAILEIGSTLAAILSLVYISPTLSALFGGKVIYEFFVILLCSILLIRNVPFHIKDINIRAAKSLLSFGFPLVWLQISMIVMTFADRYQIGYIIDAKSVGLYSAAYNLAQYVLQLVSQPLILAVYPIYNRIFKESGAEATGEFLSKIIVCYFYITIPIAVFISFHANFVLVILASKKFSSAGAIVPLILLGNILNGCLPLVSAGLYVSKKTKIIGQVTLATAILNILLNWLFIYIWGYYGAALSTLISFIVLFFVINHVSNKFLKININIINNIKYLLFSMVSILPSIFNKRIEAITLLIDAGLFILIYLLLTMFFEKRMVANIKNMLLSQ